MPHRDPETGQFVASGGPEFDQSWDDLQKMHVQQTGRIVNATGGAFEGRELPEIDLNRSDTLALDRDEMAELVALDVIAFRAYIDDNDFADQENFRAMLSIGINRALAADMIGDNDLETDNLGNAGELAGRTRLENDGATLWRVHATYQNATGTAGEGAPVMYGFQGPALVPFRDRFGQGPLVDPNDAIVHGMAFNPVNLGGNGNVVFIIDWIGYFDVFEVDLSIRRTN